jgi:hypothetical protein
MVGKRRGRAGRLAVNAALTGEHRAFARRRFNAGAEGGKPERALHLRRHRPGAVAFVEGDLIEGGASQTATGREKRDRLQDIRFACAVGSCEGDEITRNRHARRAIAAEIREHEAADAGGDHETPMSSPLRP